MKNIYKKNFYKAVNFLEDCSDTSITRDGVVIERGIEILNNHLITYHLEDNTINFYIDGEFVLSINEDSPLILMFEGLIFSMNEDY